MEKFHLFILLCLLTFTASKAVAQIAYIPNNTGSNNNLTVVDIATGMIVANIPVGLAPAGVAINENTERAYITNELSASVSVINTSENTEITTIGVETKPYGISLSADGTKAYLAHINVDLVTVINTVTNSVITTIPVGNSPRGVTLSPDGSKVYVANAASNNISVIDATTDLVTATIEVGSNPVEVIISPDNATLYVTNRGDGNVGIVNAATGVTTAIIPTTGNNPYNMAITADGSTLYVSLSFGNNTVDVIDLVTNTVTTTITVGATPTGIEITPDGSRVVVANFGSDNVSVIDIATNTVATTIDGINSAFGLGDFIFGDVAPISNDDCAIATDISAQFGQPFNEPQTTSLYDNNDFTTGTDDPAEGFNCFDEDDTLDNTGWFSFTGDGNTYRVRNVQCTGTNANLNLQVAVYSGTCGTLANVACNDDEDGASNILNFNVEFDTEEGIEYLILVDGFQGATGEFCIEVTNLTNPLLPGEMCTNAIDISSLTGQAEMIPQLSELYDNTEYGIDDTDPTPTCSAFYLRNIWFAFTGDGNRYTINSVSDLDLVAHLYSGNCENLTEVICNDDDPLGGLNFALEFQTEIGENYFLIVDDISMPGPGIFHLEITNQGTVGVTNIAATDLRIFPNPTQGVIQLPKIDLTRVEAYDATGRLVFTQQQPGTSIDLGAQPAGLYVLKLYSGAEVYSAKIVKK